MQRCPHCRTTDRQVKSSFNRTGSQSFQCQLCRRQYTPEPHPLGYQDTTKEMALKLYLEGNGFRRIGRLLSVNHQSVVNRINSFHAQLKSKKAVRPVPESPTILEMDDSLLSSGRKKASIHRDSR
jgi:transposase-like protein